MPKSLLRLITCGSVDDGKSTLIGRLLYDSKQIFVDQLATLEVESKRLGTQGEAIDFALLVDGLQAEREQGITIDVAYRFFATAKRRFIVADTPGHEQYTANMITGASNADLAVILVDARKGVATQTRRHAYLVSLIGIRNIVLAVTKMDLIDYDKAIFETIVAEFRAFAAKIDLANITAIPISGLKGDNVISRSPATGWYQGPSLIEHLETVIIDQHRAANAPFRMPVQWVNRPDQNFRGYAGQIVGGVVRTGDIVTIMPRGQETSIARIVTLDGDLAEATAGRSVTLTFSDDIDCGRGDLIASGTIPDSADQFEVTLIWMGSATMLPGRTYIIKLNTIVLNGTFATPKYKINVNTLERLAAKQLVMNDIAVGNLTLETPVAFDPYHDNHDTGGFIVIDPISRSTIAAGLIHFALRRSQNIHEQISTINKAARAALKRQKPAILWFTGLSGAGKSTIANLVEQELFALGCHTYLLDGDNIRRGLTHDLGFTDADRIENIRRVAEVAKLMVDAGMIVLVAFISPFRAERQLARELVEPGEFIEIFVDTLLELAEQRDPKGLYKKARAGQLQHFTGIDSPYEPPQDPEIHLDTSLLTAAAAAAAIIDELRRRGLLRQM